MKGFTNRAVIVLPRPEHISTRHITYKERLNRSINAMIDYLEYCGAEVYALASDEVAQNMKHPKIKFIANSSKGDSFFIKNNAENMGEMIEGDREFHKALITGIVQKYPNMANQDDETRIKLILKRVAAISSAILESEKLVVNFAAHRNPTFKIPPTNEEQERMLIDINEINNQVEVYMGGISISPLDILDFNGATRPLHLWTKEDYAK